MAKNTRVFHVVSHFAMKHGDVENGVRECALAWVEYGVSFRTLTPEEKASAQSKQAQARALREEAFGWGEIPNCRFVRPVTTTYRAPWQECLASTTPMFVKKCKWPRERVTA